MLSRLPIRVASLQEIGPLIPELAASDVIVDALLGTGLSRPVTGLQYDVIEQVKRQWQNRAEPRHTHGRTRRLRARLWEPPYEPI